MRDDQKTQKLNKLGLIICGALTYEVKSLIDSHKWDVDIHVIPASEHLYPTNILKKVEELIIRHQDRYARLIVVYGDCGTGGLIDRMLTKYSGVNRLQGPHCYEIYGQEAFTNAMKNELGTYFLTDFMVRSFEGLLIEGMGLRERPELIPIYFENYKKIVYLQQSKDQGLIKKAEEISRYLSLPLEVTYTGCTGLENRLLPLVNQ